MPSICNKPAAIKWLCSTMLHVPRHVRRIVAELLRPPLLAAMYNHTEWQVHVAANTSFTALCSESLHHALRVDGLHMYM